MSYSSTVLADSPIADWRLGDSGTTATDTSGNGRSGTLSGGVTTGAAGGPVGDSDTAMTFDGSTGYISGTYSALNSALSNHDFSIEFMGYWTGGGTGIHHAFSIGAGGSTDSAIVFATNNGGSQLFFSLYADDFYGTATTISSSAWHHCVLTFAASTKTWIMYLDGAQDSTGTSVGVPTIAGSASFTIGRAAYTSDNFWSGRLDEVAVYNAVLSSTRVLAHYNASLSGGATSGYGSGAYGASVYGPSAADSTPPTVPAGLTATALSSSRIDLNWNASTDNVGVTGYTIYRGGVAIATAVGTTYPDTTVSPSTLYSYTVDAFDAAGNHSAQSGSASATTPAAPTAPSTALTPTLAGGLGRIGPRTSFVK